MVRTSSATERPDMTAENVADLITADQDCRDCGYDAERKQPLDSFQQFHAEPGAGSGPRRGELPTENVDQADPQTPQCLDWIAEFGHALTLYVNVSNAGIEDWETPTGAPTLDRLRTIKGQIRPRHRAQLRAEHSTGAWMTGHDGRGAAENGSANGGLLAKRRRLATNARVSGIAKGGTVDPSTRSLLSRYRLQILPQVKGQAKA
jgi:hypothetical protein